MKRFITLIVVFCMICTFTACGFKNKANNQEEDIDSSQSADENRSGTEAGEDDEETGSGNKQNEKPAPGNKPFIPELITDLIFQEDDIKEEAFDDIAPMYNVPDGHEFRIKLNLKENGFAIYGGHDHFKVYMDRECTREVRCRIDYDHSTGYITIKPLEDSFFANAYPREGIEREMTGSDRSIKKKTWGSLKTYYLVVSMDITAETIKAIDKPKRMMFTVAAALDSPTVKVKVNESGNVSLYWGKIKGAQSYKIYNGNQGIMLELGETEETEFELNGSSIAMNSYVSEDTEYAVVAVKGEEVSRLSNIIKGENFARTSPSYIAHYEKSYYTPDDVATILELPREIDIEMRARSVFKTYPLIWDFTRMVRSETGLVEYVGKIPGTRFTVTYTPLDNLPTAEEIVAFNKDTQLPAAMAEDNTDMIDIPNSPSNDELPEDTSEDILFDIPEAPEQENDLTLEQTIAIGMLNHETTIDLSAYPEAGDSAYLRDLIQSLLCQYVLIMDEKYITYDFTKKELNVEYSRSQEESFARQAEVLDKVDEVIKAVVRDGMTVEEKEKALHDWIVDNGRYHDEILQAYYDGEDLGEIADRHKDSFNTYGILINGLGVCQSYAEAFKLLCDFAEVPSIVATGNLCSVPHAWNKVLLDGRWYNVDITNNDDYIPYPVYNSSDHMLKRYYTEGLDHVIDSEHFMYSSLDDSQDYYYKAGLYSQAAGELKQLIMDQLSSSDDFFIKISPDLTDEEVGESLLQAVVDLGLSEEDILVLYNLNVLGVKKVN